MENNEKNVKILEISDLSEITEERSSEIATHLDNGGSIQIRQAMGAWNPTGKTDITLYGRSALVPRSYALVDTTQNKQEFSFDRKELNNEAWVKYLTNPYVRRSQDDIAGRITGEDFGFYSREYDIRKWMDEIIYDPRNELYSSWMGYIIRKLTESELFLNLTIHEDDGFVEVDIIEPGLIDGVDTKEKGFVFEGGIVFHPDKQTMPLFYSVKDPVTGNSVFLPSIYLAYLPKLQTKIDMTRLSRMSGGLIRTNADVTRATKGKLNFGSYVLSWRHGIKEIKRTVSGLRTTFEPLEDYKEAKKWRQDYMKAMSTYFLFYEFEDLKSWLRWVALSDEQKRASGLAQVLSPGDRLFLPPGVKATIQNPQIPSLSGQDEDLLKMISSGMRQPYDMLSGDIKGPTYASIKGSRTPYMDFLSDIREMSKRFFIHDFWKAIFFIKSKFDSNYEYFKYKEVVGYKEKKERTESVRYRPEQLIDIIFPKSFNEDMNSLANAMLGSKRGPVSYHLGISKEEIANRLGFTNIYGSWLKTATEKLTYPDDILPDDSSMALDTGTGGANNQNQATPKPTLNRRKTDTPTK